MPIYQPNRINKELMKQQFAKAASTYEKEAWQQKAIANRMIDLLTHHVPTHFSDILEIGSGTGLYSRMLASRLHFNSLVLNDICEELKIYIAGILNDTTTFVAGDAENIDFTKKFDLLTSCSTFQWFQHIELFFKKCTHLLDKNGILAFSTFGEQNLHEIKELAHVALPYKSKDELLCLLAPHYEIIYSGEELSPMYFNAPMDVLYHLKHTGVNGLRETAWTKKDIKSFCEQYQSKFAQQNQVSLTYHPIYIIAKLK